MYKIIWVAASPSTSAGPPAFPQYWGIENRQIGWLAVWPPQFCVCCLQFWKKQGHIHGVVLEMDSLATELYKTRCTGLSTGEEELNNSIRDTNERFNMIELQGRTRNVISTLVHCRYVDGSISTETCQAALASRCVFETPRIVHYTPAGFTLPCGPPRWCR